MVGFHMESLVCIGLYFKSLDIASVNVIFIQGYCGNIQLTSLLGVRIVVV